ncbi:replication initiation and membrane attachment family protein [Oceanobacillus salinisoli]|uniref:replication initiation and membrane attachment family protein n=1 Tax=Oceanobacillus salinisoli TaxID=2678611 RepID=UPI0012E1FEDD|nr:DnaD domain protein [Oceanobacillus salinisoli]
MRFLGQVLPVDGYYVLLKGHLPNDFTTSLTHLYQPLIGIQAVMLYQTLLHEIELQQDSPQTHHTLMNYLNIPLDEIYKARLKLEGIGLLKSFKKERDQSTIYTYELQSPFSPNNFFKDAMLSQLLYHQLGDQKFLMLKERYMDETNEDRGENITVSFNDVFQTFTPTLEIVTSNPNNHSDQTVEPVDISWIEQMLKQRMIPVSQVLTSENRKLIAQMMRLYELDNYEIEKSVLWALNEENRLDGEEFKIACHDLFKSKHKNSTVKLMDKPALPKEQEVKKEPQTKEEMLIQELESISPKQLLEDLSGGNQASEQDMKIIRDVMTSQGLAAPVMNVLIHYVLLQSNMKLSRAYLEKIASHWSRAKIKTAKEAMEFAKKEKERFQKSSAKSKRGYTRKESKEIVPDWFKERKGNQKNNVSDQQPVINLEKEKAELQALLNQTKQKNNGFQG